MPRFSFSLLLAGALLVPALPVGAAPPFPIFDGWMQEKAAPPTQALPVDEALLALSKATSANVLADATHFETGRIVQPYPSQRTNPFDSGFGRRNGVIGYYAAQAELTYDRTAPDTLVLWSQPDKDKLVSLIVEHQKQLNEQFPRGDDKVTLTGFQEFLKTRYAWTPLARTPEEATLRAQGVDATFRLSDLPEALRAPFQAEFISQVLSLGDEPTYRWFEADYWKDSRVRLSKNRQIVLDPTGFPQGERVNSLVEIVFPDTFFDDGAGRRSMRTGRRIPIGFPQGTTPGRFTPATPPAPSRRGVQPNVARPVDNPVERPAPVELPGVNVPGEAALRKAVVFSVKQQPLAQFVAGLGKKSGVTLLVAPDVAPGAKVTGCSVAAGMPLSSVMGALSRLYSAHWTKDGDGYALSSDHPSELNRMMAQMGINAYYGWEAFGMQERDQLGTEHADEVVGAVDVAQLQTPPGVLFSDLPPDTQNSVLQFVQKERQGNLVAAQQRLDEALAQDVVFRFAPTRADTPLFYGAGMTRQFGTGSVSTQSSGIGVYSSDGAFITSLFPRFTFRPLNQQEMRFYQMDQEQAEYDKHQRDNNG